MATYSGTTDCDFGSDSELSVTESSVSSTGDEECEIEIECLYPGYYSLQEADDSDPEGPYMDEPLADDQWLEGYNQEVQEAERRNDRRTRDLV